MRAYLRLDPNATDRKADYPDGAFRAFFEALCHAEQQPQRGRFRNRKLLAVLLERRAKWIPYLIEHGDLVETKSGKLYVDGWDEWQEGDVTVSERMRRLRSRQRGVTPTDTPTVTPTVTVPTVSVPYSGGGSGKHSAEAVGAAPSRAANGAGPSGAPAAFIGMRPKVTASIDDIRRQEAEAWSKCADCGKLGREHSADGKHTFTAGVPA